MWYTKYAVARNGKLIHMPGVIRLQCDTSTFRSNLILLNLVILKCQVSETKPFSKSDPRRSINFSCKMKRSLLESLIYETCGGAVSLGYFSRNYNKPPPPIMPTYSWWILAVGIMQCFNRSKGSNWDVVRMTILTKLLLLRLNFLGIYSINLSLSDNSAWLTYLRMAQQKKMFTFSE